MVVDVANLPQFRLPPCPLVWISSVLAPLSFPYGFLLIRTFLFLFWPTLVG